MAIIIKKLLNIKNGQQSQKKTIIMRLRNILIYKNLIYIMNSKNI